MHTAKCVYPGCSREFAKRSADRAKQALKMHVDRHHLKTIKTPKGPRNGNSASARTARTNGHTGVLVAESAAPNLEHVRQLVLDKKRHQHLTPQEQQSIADFIAKYRGDYATRTAAFAAALEATGLVGRVKLNFSSVNRYCKKAENQPEGKRSYHRKPVVSVEQKVNYCPACGCAIHKVAMGMALAERM